MANQSSGGDPRVLSPTVDHRDAAALIEQMKRLAPYYTPEWRFRPDDPDPGTALFLMFAKLLEGNIRRLNQVPYKSFLTFLNRFDAKLLPARSSLAQVVFELAEGATEPVYVEPGTQLTAPPPPGELEPVLFETVDALLVSPAKLTDCLSISPKRDRIVRLQEEANEDEERTFAKIETGPDGRGVALFGPEGANLQEHVFYLKHDFLFLLNSPTYIEMTVKNTRNAYAVPETVRYLSDRNAVEWEYFSGGEWVAFDRVFGNGARIRLTKRRRARIDRTTLFGEEGYWIRCRARSLDEATGTPQLASVQLDMLDLKSDFLVAKEGDGIAPDRLYFNDIQVEADECQPFGDFFAPFGVFYIANREAFSKRGANVTMQFQLNFRQNRLLPDRPPQINWKPIMKRAEVDKTEIPDPVTIANVQWEYWNGRAWVRLQAEDDAQRIFHLPYEGTEPREIRFVVPEDLEESAVNSEDNFWIRGRILSVQNAYSNNAVYYSPTIKRLRCRFEYPEPVYPPQRFTIRNNLEVQERTLEARTGGFAFRPFLKLDGGHPALWLGFDKPPERGPIHLYWSLRTKRTLDRDVPPIEWEYLKRSGGGAVWAPLAAADDTNGFTRSGTVQFVGPRDFAYQSAFGVERYWIRAVNRDASLDAEERAADAPRALHATLNSALAKQQETLKNELPQRVETYDTVDETVRVEYVLSRTPVLSEEVWVDETETMSEEEAKKLEEEGVATDIVRDTAGDMIRCWVKYAAVPHFVLSGPRDRHYALDRASGRLSFGNGQQGKLPSKLTEDSVRVTYATGGGRRGNVPAGAIASIRASIAYIDAVRNPEPAAGGCDSGTVEEAIRRGPKLFTHRHRAVTAEDFEWLTREAHPNVARVKCLPNVNVKLEKEPGAISIVVLPKSGSFSGPFFQELKRHVEKELIRRAAANVAFPGAIQVMDPAVLEIGVQATLWVRSMEDVVPVEREAVKRLNRFLDPLTGGADGAGWDIGQIVHRSMFYALLKAVGPVLHIPQISLSVMKSENGERVEWNPERIEDVPHGIVVPGEHRILVEIGK
ncbi:putative baseplate assembly protein [Paenibacillus sp.]|uniref:putative baseplate assembly protein n=1 Tax=Paenibacillus sp. TaxID=58172 RepID=UPI0028110257|nr:putative baseplate assembly protein [Paenibacillus sp.]